MNPNNIYTYVNVSHSWSIWSFKFQIWVHFKEFRIIYIKEVTNYMVSDKTQQAALWLQADLRSICGPPRPPLLHGPGLMSLSLKWHVNVSVLLIL